MRASITFLARSAAISAALIALAPPLASAQSSAPAQPAAAAAQSAFLGATFAQVVNGREVWITTSDGSRLKARVVSMAPTGLTVNGAGTSGQGQMIRFEEITRIEKASHRLRTHTIIGMSVGAGFGLLGLVACGGESDCASALFLTYLGIGAGIGALNGAIQNSINRDDDLIYQRGLRTTTMAVAMAPIVSRTRKGLAFSVSWR